jgi:hypothetical protein
MAGQDLGFVCFLSTGIFIADLEPCRQSRHRPGPLEATLPEHGYRRAI